MSDPGLIVLEFSDDYQADIAVYMHWDGIEADSMVDDVVRSDNFRARIGDEAYAARIFIDQFTRESRDQQYGFGVFPLVRTAHPSQFAGSVSNIITVSMATGEVTR